MQRRQFLGLVGGALASPLAAHAQQPERLRRIGVLMSLTADDAISKERNAAMLQMLEQLGWVNGRNVHIEYRWPAAEAGLFRKYAQELVTFGSDVIMAYATPSAAAVQQVTRTVPTVFVSVIDPIGAGLVDSMSHPGGNLTGFALFEYSVSAKWLELLKQIAPATTQAAVIRDHGIVAGIGQFAAIQTAAPSLGVELSAINMRDMADVERDASRFAQRASNGGLIVSASPLAVAHRDQLIALAARLRMPAVYPFRYFVEAGGLLSYGPDQTEQMQQGARYLDRILKGAKPADLPVQSPTKYELFINLKTAKELGFAVPASLLARADAVIE